jgi:HSP20 family molecular chaperone IbpA
MDSESYLALIDRMEHSVQSVCNRAYAMFESRGHRDGFEVEDWLRAERDLFQVPQAEMREAEGEIHIRVAVPGFSRENLELTVLPNLIVVVGSV